MRAEYGVGVDNEFTDPETGETLTGGELARRVGDAVVEEAVVSGITGGAGRFLSGIGRGAGKLFGKLKDWVCPAKAAAKTADKFSRIPKSLMDEMALDAAKQGKGVKIIDSLSDPKFKGMEKWSYSEKSASDVISEVHYVRDPKTGELMDFKFKHHAETYK